ncbi:MAG: elongation factor G [Chloroflexi bacterium]|nr:MAG: elongation factor G [Chloroflexota bacterium]
MEALRTENIRNVVLLSHSGTGKTSLAEAMLYDSGAISRLGKVEEGNTTSDFEPEETKRGSSVSLSLLPLKWKEVKINLLDAPGYFDFIGEMKSGIRVADGALLLVCAASGVEVGTELAWRYADEAGLPRLIFINKIDRENADFYRTLSQIEARFGRKCVAIQLPHPSPDDGVLDLLSPEPFDEAIPQEKIETYREKLVEAVAETNDELVTKYLEGEELSAEELRQALRVATLEGKLIPILVGSALNNKAIPQLLDAICDFLPSPKDRGKVKVRNTKLDEEEELPPEGDAPLSALVFKTIADPYVGRLSCLRVYSGTLKSDSTVWNTNKGRAERVGQLYLLRGKNQEPVESLIAGDIGAVAKLSETSTGDTLCEQNHPVQLVPVEFPHPNFSVAVYPKTKADVDKLGTVLAKLNEEDPSIVIHKEPDTGETLISGFGEAQIEVVAEKMKRKFALEAELRPPKIPYKETITTSTKAEYKHKKQTGGHGQYGHVFLELTPLPRGSGYQFEETIVGGAIPKNFIPAVEKGVAEALQEGVLAGYPIVDIKVTLYDGSYHPVDSSDISFKIAGSHALRKGVQQANPVLLEPIMNVKITVPDEFTGDILGDLNSKRGRVLGMSRQGDLTVIEAQAPMAEMLRYAVDLRSMTQGRGTYTIEFSHYEEVPPHLAQKIIAEAREGAKEGR